MVCLYRYGIMNHCQIREYGIDGEKCLKQWSVKPLYCRIKKVYKRIEHHTHIGHDAHNEPIA